MKIRKLVINRRILFLLGFIVIAFLIIAGGALSERAKINSPAVEPTVFSQTLLNVPLFMQEKRFACNLEAARMVLSYRGIEKRTVELYEEIVKDPTPFDKERNIFGDPNLGYVGDIEGIEKGYGVHWQPISDLIAKYRPNEVKTGWDLASLLQEITNGNPVLIWAHNDFAETGKDITWTTPEGKTINAVTGMHTYVVVGYNNNIEAPTEIVLHDSYKGRWTITTSKFLDLWSVFNNTAIVVY